MKKRRLTTKSCAPQFGTPSKAAAISIVGSSDCRERDEKPRSSSGSARTAKGLAAESLKMKTPSQLSPKEFMQRQSLAHDSLQQLLGKISGKKGLLQELMNLLGSMSEEASSSKLNEKTEPLKGRILEAKLGVETLKKTLQAVTDENITEVEMQIQALGERWVELEKQVLEHMEALRYLGEAKKKEKRQSYLRDRHQVTKYKGYMTTAGYPKALARYAAAKVYYYGFLADQSAVHCDDETFYFDPVDINFDVMQAWFKPRACPMLKEMLEGMDLQGAEVENRITKAELAMDKNKKWAGCLQIFPPEVRDALKYDELKKDIEVLEDVTVGPWITTSRRWHFRFGTATSGVSGIGCFIAPMSGEWLMIGFDVALLLDQGITLANLECFMKTDAGEQFMLENGTAVRVSVGEILFVPFGWSLIQTLITVQSGYTCGHCIIWHVPCDRLLGKTPHRVWQAILQQNDVHIKSKKSGSDVVWKVAEDSLAKLAAHASGLR
jgi:hypothetical protein